MKNRTFRNWLMCVCLLLFALPAVKVNAASATMTLESSVEEIKVGETFSVVLVIESDDTIGNVETFVGFDAKKVSFVSGGIYATGGDGMVLISDWDSGEDNTIKKYSLKFKALKRGEANIYISGEPQVFSAEDATAMSVSSNRCLINVIDPSTLSTNTYLKNLSVAEGQLSPQFDKEVTEYTLAVGKTTMNLNITAETDDPDSTVTITGNENFKEGANKVIINVEAPSGKAKQYIIDVTKQPYETVADGAPSVNPTQPPATASEAQQEPTIPEATQESVTTNVVQEEGFHARKEAGDIYLSDNLQIQVVDPEDESKVPKGYIRTNIRVDEVTIPVYTKENDLENPVLLIYGKNSAGEMGFYQYNREEGTLQKYNGSFVASEDNISNEEMEEQTGKNSRLFFAIGVLCIICAVLMVVVILLYMQLREKKAKSRDDYFAM